MNPAGGSQNTIPSRRAPPYRIGDKTLAALRTSSMEMRSPALPAAPGTGAPAQPLHHLDALWIQVAGTLCNLACTHCFVSSGPGDDHHALMSRDQVRGRVAEGVALG